MDHSVGSVDNDEDVAAAVEKVLSATMGAKRTIKASRQNQGGSKNLARPTRQPSKLLR